MTGEIPDGLRSCPEDGMIVIAGKSPEVSVLPRDPQKTSIGEYDFQGFEQRDGTASFTVTCP
ncbi:hypothetical protein [Microbacterium sp. NPDC087868]|uniref:hypothetical protein n=1 Tax=Microbacterium sp. NPDC087868 TaxID=3364195 RepID=UPI00384E536A